MSNVPASSKIREELLQTAAARRDLAAHARPLAADISNEMARRSLLVEADELDQQATELEAQAGVSRTRV